MLQNIKKIINIFDWNGINWSGIWQYKTIIEWLCRNNTIAQQYDKPQHSSRVFMYKQSNESQMTPNKETDDENLQNLYFNVFRSSNWDDVAMYAGSQRTVILHSDKK